MAAAEQTKARTVTLVQSGEAQGMIIVPQNADARIEGAARDLAHYVQKSTGALLPIVPWDQLPEPPEGKSAIYLGQAAIAYDPSLKEDLKGLQNQGFVLYSRPPAVLIAGPTVSGTLHGVYEFLERYVGVRWLMLGPVGEDVPQQEDLVIPEADVTQEPRFAFRQLSPYTGDPLDGETTGHEGNLWAQRNRLQGSHNAAVHFHHNLYNLFPPEKYGKTHPEFYPRGEVPEPGNTKRWQPSFTAPGSVEAAAQGIIEYFDQNPEVNSYSLGVNDIGGFCEQDPEHPHYPGRYNSIGLLHMSEIYYAWVNQVVERVSEKYPDKWYGLLAYRELVDPPAFPVHPQVVPVVTKDRMAWMDEDIKRQDDEQMQGWKAVARQTAWYDYMYGFYYLVPRIFPHLLADNLRYAADQGVFGMYTEMAYSAVDGPKAWLVAKLLWDPYHDVDTLLQEWYERAVGPAAAPALAAFYTLWERFWEERIKASEWFQNSKGATYLSFTSPLYLRYVTDADIEESRRLLDAVVEKAQTQEQKARARLIREGFEFGAVSALSYPKPARTPTDAAEAVRLLESILPGFRRRQELAGRRYELLRRLRQHTDPNLRREIREPMWIYWWKHWSGWSDSAFQELLAYIRAREPAGGPVTERIRSMVGSTDKVEATVAAYLLLGLNAEVTVTPLTANSAFADGTDGWTILVTAESGKAEARAVQKTENGLLIEGAQRIVMTQDIDVGPGLAAARIRYRTAAPAGDGLMVVSFQVLNAEGRVLASLNSEPVPLAEGVGEWRTAAFVDELPTSVGEGDDKKVAAVRVAVTLARMHTTRLELGAVEVYQDIPAVAILDRVWRAAME